MRRAGAPPLVGMPRFVGALWMAAALALGAAGTAAAARPSFYEYTDARGQKHVVSDLSQVPPAYLEQARPLNLPPANVEEPTRPRVPTAELPPLWQSREPSERGGEDRPPWARPPEGSAAAGGWEATLATVAERAQALPPAGKAAVLGVALALLVALVAGARRALGGGRSGAPATDLYEPDPYAGGEALPPWQRGESIPLGDPGPDPTLGPGAGPGRASPDPGGTGATGWDAPPQTRPSVYDELDPELIARRSEIHPGPVPRAPGLPPPGPASGGRPPEPLPLEPEIPGDDQD